VEFNAREDVLAAQTKNMKQVDGHKIEIQVGTGSTLYVTNFPAVADERYIRNIFKDVCFCLAILIFYADMLTSAAR
jgi:hypothetical protein